MGPFLLLNAALVGFFGFASVYHLTLWWTSRREPLLAVFGVDCALRAAFSGVVMGIATSETIAEAQGNVHARIAFGILVMLTWLWTLSLISEVRAPRFVLPITIFLLVLFPVHVFFVPLEATVVSLDKFTFPWGEMISYPRLGPPGWWFGPLYLTVITIESFGVYCGRQIWKKDHVGGALITLAASMLLMLHAIHILRAFGLMDVPFVGVAGHVFWACIVGLVIARRNHQMREALAASEQRFRGIFDQTFQFIGLLSVDGILLDANHMELDIAGSRIEQEIGKLFWRASWWSHSIELQDRIHRYVLGAANGQTVRFEATRHRSDENLSYIDLSIKPLRDEQGKTTLLIAEGRDITERKNSEETLRQRVAELTILNRIGVICAEANATGELLRRATEVIGSIRSSENFGFMLLDPERSILVAHPSFVLSDPTARRSDQPQGVGITGRVAETGRAECHADGPSKLCLPIQIGSNVVGVFVMESQRPNAFTPAEEKLLRTVIDIVGNSLERLRAEQTLRESEIRFRLVFEGASDAIFWADAETGLLTHCNLAAEALVGRERSEIIGQPQTFLHPLEKADHYREIFRNHAESAIKSPIECEVLRKDGRRIMTSIAPSVTTIGERRVVQGVFRDITERKRNEESLRASEQRFAQFMEHLPGLAWIKDSQGRYQYANDNALQVFRTSRNDLEGKTDNDLFPSETAAQFQMADQQALASETGIHVIETLEHADGSVHHSIVSKFRLPAPNGIGLLVGGVAIDITERLDAENELQRSLSLLTATLESTAEGILVVDLAGRIVTFNTQFISLWRIPKEVLSPRDDRKAIESVLDQLCNPDEFLAKVQELYSHPEATSFDSLKFKDGRVYERYSHPQRLGDQIVGRVWSFRDVTDRERTAESLQMMRFSVDHAGDSFFWVGRNGRVLYANDAACEKRGYSRDELLEMTIFELDPDYQAGVWEPHFEDLKRRGSINLESRHLTKDGQIFPIEVTANYVHIGDKEFNFAFVRDITERKQREHRIGQLAAIVESSNDAIFSTSLDGTITSWNRGAIHVFGYSESEMLGQSVATLIPPDRVEEMPQVLGRIAQGKHINDLESVACGKNDKRIDVLMSISPVWDSDGRLVGASTIARDVTERKKAEEERQKLEAQILHAQKLESLGVLAGGIAHDFNNLLTVMLGNAGLSLMLLSKDSPAAPMLREIELAANRAADLTQQMLAYAGKGRFVIEPLRLDSVVGEMSNLLKAAVSKKATVELSLDPATIDGDATQIRQVMMNLIMNASEALDGNIGIIRIRTGVRHAEAAELNSPFIPETLPTGFYAFVKVEDNGCGMSEETQARIFDPFFTTKFAGRGLGLAAVLGIVRGHQGTIKIDSAPGRGTVFQVLFPCTGATQTEPVESAPKQPRRGQGTVLVIEDEDIIHKFVRHVLEGAGFEVLTAVDGQEGLKIFHERSAEIVAVLLDLTMPRMDGFEVLQELRSLGSDIPVVVMSGYAEHFEPIRYAVGTASGFIQKPFTPQDLIARVFEILPNSSHSD